MTDQKPLNLTNETFDATIQNGTSPVLVDFWAEWCGPCRMIAPVLDELAREEQGRAVVAKVNVDAAPELAQRFGVSRIPTLIVFKIGAPVQTIQGVQSKAALKAVLAA